MEIDSLIHLTKMEGNFKDSRVLKTASQERESYALRISNLAQNLGVPLSLWELRTSSWARRMFSLMFLPLMKADWWGPTNSSSTSLSRCPKMDEIFFTRMLHNEIGLNSSKTSGLSTLGISSRKVELTCFNSFPLQKKFDTALHTSCLMIPQQTWKSGHWIHPDPGLYLD